MQNTTNHVSCVIGYILGKLNIKQTEGNTHPVSEHIEYHLSVKIVKEREQQRTAGRNLRQEEQHAHLFFSSSSQWNGRWTSSWWDKSWQCKETSTILSGPQLDSDGPP